MSDYLTYFKAAIAIAGGMICGLLGGWDVALQVLVIFTVVDYLTGVAAAWYQKKLDSNVGLRGIAKKILLFVPVGVGYWLDTLLGHQILRSLAIFFYIANEGLSCMENLGQVGIPLPNFLKDALEQLKNKAETGERNASGIPKGD